MRLLFVGNADSPLIHNLALEMKRLRPGLVIDIISDVPCRSAECSGAFDSVFVPTGGGYMRRTRGVKFLWYARYYSRLLDEVPNGYDVVHVFYLSAIWGALAKSLRAKAGRMIVTLFGSDVYRTYWPLSLLQLRLLDKADHFTASNPHTLEVARSRFRRQLLPCEELLFGLRSLEYLREMVDGGRESARRAFGIAHDAIVVACGYNGSRNQNHLAMFNAIEHVAPELRQRLFLLVPLTSGGSAPYIEEIRRRLQAMGVGHRIFDVRLHDREVAMIRCAADILIQVQSTDQLSGSMLEHLFAGSVLLTGAWLPYDQLRGKGVVYWTTPTLNELGSDLKACLMEFDVRKAACLGNREIVWGMTAWSHTAPQWSALYD